MDYIDNCVYCPCIRYRTLIVFRRGVYYHTRKIQANELRKKEKNKSLRSKQFTSQANFFFSSSIEMHTNTSHKINTIQTTNVMCQQQQKTTVLNQKQDALNRSEQKTNHIYDDSICIKALCPSNVPHNVQRTQPIQTHPETSHIVD